MVTWKKAVSGFNFEFLLLFALLCLHTAFLIGDQNVRLANTSSDISPVAFTYYLSNPENFATDMVMKTQVPSFLGSMQNWLPFLLFHYFGFPPEMSALFLVYLQNVMLGLAMFHLAMVVSSRREVAWLSVLFLLAFRPDWWNLAVYGDLNWMPYAGHLAFPFLIYAFSFAIENRTYKTFFFLILGALFHPGLTIYATAMIGAYQLRSLFRQPSLLADFYLKIFLLLAVVALCVIPVKIATLGVEEVPLEKVIPLLMQNGHTIPWANPACSYCLSGFLRSLLFLPLLFVFSWLAMKKACLNHQASLLWKISLLICVALCLLHPLAVAFQLATLIRLITFRSTILMIVLSLPFMMTYVIDKFLQGGFGVRMLIAYVILMPSTIVILAALLVFVAAEAGVSKTIRFQHVYLWAGRFLTAGTLGILIAVGIPSVPTKQSLITSILSSPLNISTVSYIDNTRYLFLVVTMVFAAYLMPFEKSWRDRLSLFQFAFEGSIGSLPFISDGTSTKSAWHPLWIMSPLLLVLVWSTMTNTYRTGIYSTTGETRAYYEVQRWAHDHTPVGSGFVQTGTSVYDGWRSISQRPVIAPYEIAGYYFYSSDALHYSEELADFFSRYCDFTEEPYRSHGGVSACYTTLDENGLVEFAGAFGADYLVKRVADQPLHLPVVYQNDYYLVYKFPE